MTLSLHQQLIVLAHVAVRSLPAPVREALDAWSLRVARRRALERQRKWQQLKEQQQARTMHVAPVSVRQLID